MHHAAVLDGRVRGHQRLPQHLSAEHLRAAGVAALAAKQVDLEALELELLLQVGEARIHRVRAQSNLNMPFMIAEWPGKLQKNVYASPFLSCEVGNLTVSVWPPPMTLVCAITRASPSLT